MSNYNDISFKDRDIDHVKSKSLYKQQNGSSDFKNETRIVSDDGTKASKLILKNKNEKSSSKFKEVRLTNDGGVVLKNKNGKSSERKISTRAAKRKIKRLSK